MLIIFGKPNKREINFIQFLILLIDSFILAFSSRMIFFISKLDDLAGKKGFGFLDKELHYKHITNSFQFLIFALKQMSFFDFAYIVIMTVIIFVLTLRVTLWAGDDDRIII